MVVLRLGLTGFDPFQTSQSIGGVAQISEFWPNGFGIIHVPVGSTHDSWRCIGHSWSGRCISKQRVRVFFVCQNIREQGYIERQPIRDGSNSS